MHCNQKRNEAYLRPKVRHLYNSHSHCGICGHRIIKQVHANVDHIIPKSKGGSDDSLNLQLTHRWCNQRKQNSTSNEKFTFAWNIKCMALFEMGLAKFGHEE